MTSASLIKGEMSYALHGYKSTEHFVYAETFIVEFCIYTLYIFWTPIHYLVFGCCVKKFEENKQWVEEVRDRHCIKYSPAGDGIYIDPKNPRLTNYIHQLVSAPSLVWDGWERRDEITHMKHALHEHMEMIEGETPSEDSEDGSEGPEDGVLVGEGSLPETFTEREPCQSGNVSDSPEKID